MSDEQLFNQYKPLAYKIANAFSRSRPEYRDEITNAALYGVWESIQGSKEREPNNFKTFTSGVIKNTILTELNRIDILPKRIRKEVKDGTTKILFLSIDKERDDADDSRLNPVMLQVDSISDDSSSNLFENAEVRHNASKVLNEVINTLSDDYRNLINDLFFEERSTADIAAATGTTRSNVYDKKKRVLSLLKRKVSSRLRLEERYWD